MNSYTFNHPNRPSARPVFSGQIRYTVQINQQYRPVLINQRYRPQAHYAPLILNSRVGGGWHVCFDLAKFFGSSPGGPVGLPIV